MEQIIVGFSTPKKFNLFSESIKFVEKTPYSHVYIQFYSNTYNRNLIYQASGLEVNFISLEKFQDHSNIIKEFTLDVSLQNKTRMIQYAIDMIGVPYGIKSILGIGIVLFLQLFGIKIKNPFGSGQLTMFCSKLIEYVLKDDLNLDINYDPELVKPVDIYNYLATITGE